MTQFPIGQKSSSVSLDSSGNGSVTIGPTRSGQSWDVTSVAVRTATQIRMPTARIYSGNAADENFLTGTYAGSQDTDNTVNVSLYEGQYLTCVWLGGDPGTRATITVDGTVTIS